MIPDRYVVRTTMGEAVGAVFLALLSQGREVIMAWGPGTHFDLTRSLTLHDWWSWFEAAALILAAVAVLDAVLRLVYRPERVVLDTVGVLVLDHSDEVIPWGAIAAVRSKGSNRVDLSLRDPDRYPRTAWRRWLPGFRMKGADVAISVKNQDRRDELLAAFESWRPAIVRTQ